MEDRRLEALGALGLIDSVPEEAFDAIVALAAQLLDMPGACIGFIDGDRAWYKARHNVPLAEVPRELSFCNHVVSDNSDYIVEDLACDPRFRDHPMVAGAPALRFYAGMAIRVTGERGERMPIGTLCVLDYRSRTLTTEGRTALRRLADLAETLVCAHANARRAADVAALAEAQSAALARQELIFREAERMALIGSWRLDLLDDRVSWSDGVYRIHGLPVGAMPVLSEALDFYPAAARAHVSAMLAHTIATGEPFDFEEDFITAQGDQRRVRSRGERESVDGVPIALVGVFQDVTDHHAVATQLRRTADIDELTGIANRAAFNRTLSTAIDAAHATGTPLLLALIDLDGFKAINDTLGHLAGDDVLRATGRRLQGAWLNQSHAARLGGDEFALIVDDPALIRDPADFAARLQAELCLPVRANGLTIATSGTVGAAMLDRHDTMRDFVHAADTDLYAAKRRRIGNRRRTDRRTAA